ELFKGPVDPLPQRGHASQLFCLLLQGLHIFPWPPCSPNLAGLTAFMELSRTGVRVEFGACSLALWRRSECPVCIGIRTSNRRCGPVTGAADIPRVFAAPGPCRRSALVGGLPRLPCRCLAGTRAARRTGGMPGCDGTPGQERERRRN